MMQIKLRDTCCAFEEGTTVQAVFSKMLLAQEQVQVLCAQREGECLELSEPLFEDCTLTPLTYADEEGRRCYERSLRFLLLVAIKNLCAGKRVRVLHSIGYGVYLRIVDEHMSHELIARIEAEMRRLVKADLPFQKREVSLAECIQQFEKQGFEDKLPLFDRENKAQTVPLYEMDGLHEYFYGVMLPSTGCIHTFALKAHFPGMVLMAPSPKDVTRPASYESHAKFLRVFDQSQRWCHIMGVQNASDVNRLVKQNHYRSFIRINEALHDKSIANIADEIMQRTARIIMVFGPSSSGKTTFANRLDVHLRVLGQKPRLLSLDNFYLNRSQTPKNEDGSYDLETVEALDIPLLVECLQSLLSGEKVKLPIFDFITSSRKETGTVMQLHGDQPLIIEGIHGMNDRITSHLPEQLTFGIYVSALACINLDDHNRIRTTDVRLLRRIVRDMRYRNQSPIDTIRMWPQVRKGEEQWIFPNQEKADVMFNTSLQYELPVLKTIAYDLLTQIEKNEPEAMVATRLIHLLSAFLDVDETALAEIPPTSILREFIGESSF